MAVAASESGARGSPWLGTGGHGFIPGRLGHGGRRGGGNQMTGGAVSGRCLLPRGGGNELCPRAPRSPATGDLAALGPVVTSRSRARVTGEEPKTGQRSCLFVLPWERLSLRTGNGDGTGQDAQLDQAMPCPPSPLAHSLGVCHEPVGIGGGIWLPYGHPAARAAMGPGTCRGTWGGGAQQHGPSEVWGLGNQRIVPKYAPRGCTPRLCSAGGATGEPKVLQRALCPTEARCREKSFLQIGNRDCCPEHGVGPGVPRPPLILAVTVLCSGVLPDPPLSCPAGCCPHPRARVVTVLPALPWGGPKPRDACRPPAKVPAGRQTGSRLWSSDGRAPNKKPEPSFTGVPACGGRTLVPSGGC